MTQRISAARKRLSQFSVAVFSSNIFLGSLVVGLTSFAVPTALAAPLVCTSQDANLIAHWKLDEAVASDPVLDDTGNGHTGTPSGFPTPVAAAPGITYQNDAAKDFDGADDGIDVGSNVGNFTIADSFTISAWINPALDSQDHAIYGTTWSTAGMLLRVTAGNKLRLILVENGSTYNGMDSSVLGAGWHHVVGTWDGTDIKLYIDGVEDSATAITSGVVTTITTSNNAFIGRTPEAGNEKYFDGSIDDVRVYDQPLNATQIGRLASGYCGADLTSSSTDVVSSLNPSTFGTNVTFTATVSSALTATGSVDLMDGAAIIDTQVLVAGVATFDTASLSVGMHSITAVFGGDSEHSGSTSTPVLLQVVDQAITTTTLGSNLNPSTYNANVTFTATVSGGVSPTGTVNLMEDGVTLIDTEALIAGEATFNISNLSVGSHSLTAVYSGDTNNTTSTSSPALSQVVDKAVTSTALVPSLNPSMDTDTVTFTATVTGETPTGTVTFKDNGVTLGTTAVDGAGVATYDATTLTLVGSGALHPITAEYNGDTNNEISTSNTVNQEVNTLPQLTVIKYVVNDNSGSYVVSNFSLFIDATPVTSGIENTVSVGAHVVSETPDSQYEGLFTIGDCDADGNVTLALNEEKTCIITNDDRPAHIIVIKDVINDNGGTLVASDFTMYVSGNSPDQASFAGSGTGIDVTINAGSYDVTEDADAGYASSYSCDCAGVLLPGETKTCTITNDDIQPLLTVNKVVINDDTDNTRIPADYPLFVSSVHVTNGDQNGFDAGTYAITEIGDSFHTTSFSGDCAADGSITLAIGMTYSCTVTNDDIAELDDDEPEEDVGTGTNRGSGTQRLQFIAQFVTGNAFGSIAPGAFGGASDVPFSDSEMNVICSMQESLPEGSGNGVIEWIATYLANLLNRDVDIVVDALKDPSLCVEEAPQAKAPAKPVAFHVTLKGYPVSSNETWNKCLTGTVTLEDIRTNPDKNEDGLARDCSDYHTANVWYHPDHKIYFTFDRKKKLVSLPNGYVVQKDEAVTQR